MIRFGLVPFTGHAATSSSVITKFVVAAVLDVELLACCILYVVEEFEFGASSLENAPNPPKPTPPADVFELAVRLAPGSVVAPRKKVLK